MAAPIRLTFCKLNFYKNFSSIRKIKDVTCQRNATCTYSTLAEESKELEIDIEEEINKLRDVSNLTNFQKETIKGRRTFNMNEIRDNPKFNRKYYRKMYATYGKASGIDPSIMWPSEEELKNLVDIDQNWTASFEDLRNKLREKKEAEEKDKRERELKVAKAMAKMPQLIAEFKQQGKKAGKTKVENIEQQEEIYDQFIEHFGYEPTERRNHTYMKFVAFKKFELDRQKKMEKKEKKQTKKKKESEKVKKEEENVDQVVQEVEQ